MNMEQVRGHWTEIKGKLKERFGKLTDDDLIVNEGIVEQLEGKLQQTYGYEKEQAHKELDEIFRMFEP